MDASDIIRKLQSEANYGYYRNKMAKTQPLVNISTNIGTLSTIKLVYPTYEERQRVAQGLYSYNGFSTFTIVPVVNSGNVAYKPALPRYDAPIM